MKESPTFYDMKNKSRCLGQNFAQPTPNPVQVLWDRTQDFNTNTRNCFSLIHSGIHYDLGKHSSITNMHSQAEVGCKMIIGVEVFTFEF